MIGFQYVIEELLEFVLRRLELMIPTSAYQALGLQACSTKPSNGFTFLNLFDLFFQIAEIISIIIHLICQ